MNNNFLLVSVAVLFNLFLSAQKGSVTTFKPVLGIRAGMNFQNINGKESDGSKVNSKSVAGFHLGLNTETVISASFYIQMGVLFSTKGAILEAYNNAKITLNYIEIPLNLLYKPALGSGHMLVGFGPYISIGVGGNEKFDGRKSPIIFRTDVEPNTPAIIQYKRMDVGLNFLTGYSLKRVSFHLNVQLGLLNIKGNYSNPANKIDYKNRGLGFSVGYQL